MAAAEDGAVEPGEPVPNDNYVVDEGHRLLTYIVPADARVTVLTESPEGTPISVEELAQIVAGNAQAAVGADHDGLLDPHRHRHGHARSTSSTTPDDCLQLGRSAEAE